MRRAFLLLTSLLLGATASVFADHLPPALVAHGKPEHLLAGVDVYRTTLDSLLKTLGQPASLKRYPATEESAEAEWHLHGSVIHASVNANGIAYAVEVSGEPSALAATGKGLHLGGSLTEVKRDYGSRLLQQGDQVTVQWSDETELRLKFSGKRIRSMLLIANVE